MHHAILVPNDILNRHKFLKHKKLAVYQLDADDETRLHQDAIAQWWISNKCELPISLMKPPHVPRRASVPVPRGEKAHVCHERSNSCSFSQPSEQTLIAGSASEIVRIDDATQIPTSRRSKFRIYEAQSLTITPPLSSAHSTEKELSACSEVQPETIASFNAPVQRPRIQSSWSTSSSKASSSELSVLPHYVQIPPDYSATEQSYSESNVGAEDDKLYDDPTPGGSRKATRGSIEVSPSWDLKDSLTSEASVSESDAASSGVYDSPSSAVTPPIPQYHSVAHPDNRNAIHSNNAKLISLPFDDLKLRMSSIRERITRVNELTSSPESLRAGKTPSPETDPTTILEDSLTPFNEPRSGDRSVFSYSPLIAESPGSLEYIGQHEESDLLRAKTAEELEKYSVLVGARVRRWKEIIDSQNPFSSR